MRAALLSSSVALLAACSLVGSASPGGIHARMGYSEAGGLRVVEVPADGPAARAGLEEGDRITHVDGDSVAEMRMQEVVDRLRGPVGSEVQLSIVRAGNERSIAIRRAAYAPDGPGAEPGGTEGQARSALEEDRPGAP